MTNRSVKNDDGGNFPIVNNFSFGMIKIEPEDMEIENFPKDISVKIEDIPEEQFNEDIQPDKNNESVDQVAFDEIKIEFANELPREHSNEDLYERSTSSNNENENELIEIKVEIDNCLQNEVDMSDSSNFHQGTNSHKCEVCGKLSTLKESLKLFAFSQYFKASVI